MPDVDELKIIIRETIKNSDEYRLFKMQEVFIMKNPDLMRQINDFRKYCFEYNNCTNNEGILTSQQYFEDRFGDSQYRDIVHRYLDSEMCLCRYVQDLCNTVVDAVDFGLDFLS